MNTENETHSGWSGLRMLYWIIAFALLLAVVVPWVMNGFKSPMGLCSEKEVIETVRIVEAAPVVEPAPVVEVVPEPVVVTPYELTAAVDANRNAVLSGYVPDQAAMDSITAAAAANYGSNVVNNLQILDGAPLNWVQTAVATLANINPLSNGRIEMRDLNISISGDATSQSEADGVQSNLVGGIVAPYNSSYSISAPSAAVVAANTCQSDFNNLLSSQNINFASGAAVIDSGSYALLDQIAATAANCPAASISVEGHTDSQGDDASNLSLSEQRAQAVVSYLTNQGVDGTRMTSIGYGETLPIGDNTTPAGRASNRRIEFNVSTN